MEKNELWERESYRGFTIIFTKDYNYSYKKELIVEYTNFKEIENFRIIKPPYTKKQILNKFKNMIDELLIEQTIFKKIVYGLNLEKLNDKELYGKKVKYNVYNGKEFNISTGYSDSFSGGSLQLIGDVSKGIYLVDNDAMGYTKTKTLPFTKENIKKYIKYFDKVAKVKNHNFKEYGKGLSDYLDKGGRVWD